VAEIDGFPALTPWNIYQAQPPGHDRRVRNSSPSSPDYLLIDAMQLDVLIEQKSLIKG